MSVLKHAAWLIFSGSIWIITAPGYFFFKKELIVNYPIVERVLFGACIFGGIYHVLFATCYVYLMFFKDDHNPRHADFADVQPMRLEVRYEPNYDRPPGIRRERSEQNGRQDEHPLVDPA